MKIRNCSWCNVEFKAYNAHNTFCSKKCVSLKYRSNPDSKIRQKEYLTRTKEKRSNKEKELRAKFPEKFKNIKLKKRYGITIDDYNEMLRVQNNKCKICNLETKLHVDHCHKTNKIRGLLCNGCNRGLGYFSENKQALLKAVEYLSDEN